jgi:transcriptional regulator with XRE-family HTH domain
MLNQEFSEYLKSLREGKKLSLRNAAKEAAISTTYLWQIEKGERMPSAEMLKKLGAAYGVSVNDLLEKAGYLEKEGKGAPELEQLQWAMNVIATDPTYRFGIRLDPKDLNVETMRFIVDLYQKTTGKKLLM